MAKMFSFLSPICKTLGGTLESIGLGLQGSAGVKDIVNKHTRIINVGDKKATIADDVFIAPNASVYGDVNIKEKASVWFGSVLRGDGKQSVIGESSVIRDRSILNGVTLGNSVLVGEGCVLKECNIGNLTIIEPSAIVLKGANVGSQCQIVAGAVVEENTNIPDGQLWGGSPAKYIRLLSDKEKETATKHVSDAYIFATAYEKAATETFDDELKREVKDETRRFTRAFEAKY